jgi:hypothetical protein
MATTYYVSKVDGNDTYDGLYDTWQGGLNGPLLTMTHAVVHASGLGDMVYFRRGGSWRETLTVPRSGDATHQQIWGAYGSGDLPKIYGSDLVTAWDQTDIPGEWGDLSAESFEGGGYEESWTEQLSGDSIIDEDCVEVTPPTGGDNETLKIQTVTVGDSCRVYRNIGSDTPLTYTRCSFKVAAEAIGAVSSQTVLYTNNAAYNVPFSIQLYKDGSSNRYFRLQLYNNGANAYYLSDNTVNLDQWYCILVYYDDTSHLWSWEIDDVEQDSGSITGTHRTGPKYWYLGQLGTVSATMTVYCDLFAISTTGVVEDPIPLPANCWKAAHPCNPWMVWFNEGGTITEGTRETVMANVNAKYDFFWHTLGYLITYSTTDPDSAYTWIEGGNRHTGINCGTSYVTIKNFELLYTAHGIQLTGTYNLITENYFHDFLMFYIGANSFGCTGVAVKNTDNEISYNTFRDLVQPCTDYSHFGRCVDQFGQTSRTYVHHNFAFNVLGFMEAGAASGNPTISDIRYEYNMSLECGRFTGINNNVGDYQVTPDNFKVLNNTIVATSACTIPTTPVNKKFCVIAFDTTGSSGQYYFRNNIVSTDGFNRLASGWLTFDHDHNCFYILNPTGDGFNIAVEDPDRRTNPLFVNYGGTTPEDYKLASNSPCINAGVDVGLTEDYFGNKVPQ